MDRLNRLNFLVLLLLSFEMSSVAQSYTSPTGKDYPIVAWYSIEPGKNNYAEYEKLAKAGFNLSLSYFNSYDELCSSLLDAELLGIKLIAHCPEISNASGAILEQIQHSRALGMYYLKDEPSALDFSRIIETSKRIIRVDSIHQQYVNLLPIYASKECFFTLSVSTLLGLSKTTGNLIAFELNSLRKLIIAKYQITVAMGLLLPLAEKLLVSFLNFSGCISFSPNFDLAVINNS